MIRIATISTKIYDFGKGVNYNFKQPVTVDWGDGTQKVYTNLKEMKHTYKKFNEYCITINTDDNEELPRFDFYDDVFIKEVSGILPRIRSGLQMFFKNCRNLVYVEPNFFKLNRDAERLDYMCENCNRLGDLTFLYMFKDVKYAPGLIKGCYEADYNDLTYWGEKLVNLDYAFSDNPYSDNIPNENLLFNKPELESAKGLFKGNYLMYECKEYFSRNKKLKDITDAFAETGIDQIYENWFYHLPTSLKTPKHQIFDSTIDII